MAAEKRLMVIRSDLCGQTGGIHSYRPSALEFGAIQRCAIQLMGHMNRYSLAKMVRETERVLLDAMGRMAMPG